MNKELLVLLLVLALTAALRLAFLHEPLERDEGLYAYIGQVILDGGVPYRDAMDQKPPGIHFIFAAMIALGDGTPESFRIITAVYALATVVLIWLCTRRLFGAVAALAAAAGYGIFSSGPLMRGSSSNSEVFMVLPVVAGIYLFIRWLEERRNWQVMASGLCAGCAMVIKTVALPHLLVPLLFIACCGTGNFRGRVVAGVRYLLPAVLLALGTIIWFWYRGAYDDYYYWTITFNRMYGETTVAEFFARMRVGLVRVMPELLPLLLPALPAALLILLRDRDPRRLFAASCLPAAYVGLSMPTKFFEHYFIQLVPPLAICAGAGISLLWQRKKLFVAALPFLAAALINWGIREFPFYFQYTPQEVSTKKYGTDVFVRAAEVAAYVRSRTGPADYIYQWGFEPEIYYLAGRRSPNPYTVHFAVSAAPNPRKAAISLAASLIKTRPRYIIVQGGREHYYGYDVLAGILDRSYLLETTIGGMAVWRLAA
jgi:4-amino-4-deoxy-L-arabinose transferase-like glycosyltransferase